MGKDKDFLGEYTPMNEILRGKIFSMNRAILFSTETNDAFTGFLSQELARSGQSAEAKTA